MTHAEDEAVSFADVQAAAVAIDGQVVRTATATSRVLSRITGAEVVLKYETQQFTGSYKERGALNRLLALSARRAAPRRGGRLRRKPCAGRGPSRHAARHRVDDRHAARHPVRQGRPHARAGGQRRAVRAHVRRGRGARPGDRRRGCGPHPPVRRSAGGRRPGHGRLGDAPRPPGSRRPAGPDRRRRARQRNRTGGGRARARPADHRRPVRALPGHGPRPLGRPEPGAGRRRRWPRGSPWPAPAR